MLFTGRGTEAVSDLKKDEGKDKVNRSLFKRVTNHLIPVLTKIGVTDLKVDEKGPYFERKEIVTFGDTNAEGNVSHDTYAKIFGKVRELFGLACIPRFKVEAGKVYLLKTKKTSYKFRRDFFFGDEMVVKMRVAQVNGASFVLKADFVGPNGIHAVGEHLIAYADMESNPKRIPQELKILLKATMSNC